MGTVGGLDRLPDLGICMRGHARQRRCPAPGTGTANLYGFGYVTRHPVGWPSHETGPEDGDGPGAVHGDRRSSKPATSSESTPGARVPAARHHHSWRRTSGSARLYRKELISIVSVRPGPTPMAEIGAPDISSSALTYSWAFFGRSLKVLASEMSSDQPGSIS
jgi:hypothetical protein